ncbi:hypothetical protein KCP73_01820 [Salmonella enterica subsp. enterica]|nr:hypothetical protein KCP73_01820 [Salmonella enterica subsp. enterica]
MGLLIEHSCFLLRHSVLRCGDAARLPGLRFGIARASFAGPVSAVV